MSSPRVSIIIVTWNALPLLQQFLPSVMATDYPDFEVILADNASGDGTADWVAAAYPQARVVRNPENWGFSQGNNAALPYATGTYVVLLNNDVEVPPGWLHPLVAAMEADPHLGAVQPKLLQYDQRGMFEYAGASGGFLDRYGYPFTRGRLFFSLEPDEGQYDDACNVFWASGAALLLRGAALDEVGVLDEQFFMHMEEIDLCWRLQRKGWRIGVVPGSTVYHLGGGSLPQGNARKTYYNFRNSLLMLYKNLPPQVWWRTFPSRLLLDTLAVLRALGTLHFAEAWAILRAYNDAHWLKGDYEDQRPKNDEPAFVLPPYHGSIVLDYFLRGHKRFSDLPTSRFTLGPSPSEHAHLSTGAPQDAT